MMRPVLMMKSLRSCRKLIDENEKAPPETVGAFSVYGNRVLVAFFLCFAASFGAFFTFYAYMAGGAAGIGGKGQ